MHKVSVATAAALAAVLTSTGAMAGKDLDAVKARGALICGVGTGTAGFMLADSQGKWVRPRCRCLPRRGSCDFRLMPRR